MSYGIYEGTTVEQSYAAGRDLGRSWADADAGGPRDGIADDMRAEARTAIETAIDASGRSWAAFKLGLVRGYREVIR